MVKILPISIQMFIKNNYELFWGWHCFQENGGSGNETNNNPL